MNSTRQYDSEKDKEGELMGYRKVKVVRRGGSYGNMTIRSNGRYLCVRGRRSLVYYMLASGWGTTSSIVILGYIFEMWCFPLYRKSLLGPCPASELEVRRFLLNLGMRLMLSWILEDGKKSYDRASSYRI